LIIGLGAGLVAGAVVLGVGLVGRQEQPASGSVLVGAGDIAGCEARSDDLTARLLDDIPGTVFTLGDNAYPSGSLADFSECYETSWGRHRDRTRPVPGNHDYWTPDAAGYFGYFGDRAGDPAEGFYAYSLGDWNVYALNSNCDEIGGCDSGSKQYEWLASELRADQGDCSIAYWHHPILTAAETSGTDAVGPLVDLLYEAAVEVLLTASSHSFERFAPVAPDGSLDRDRGIRVFVVGTGGAALRPLGPPLPATEASDDSTHGVLKLTLHAGWYEWAFVPADGEFRDNGTATCHSVAGA